MDAMTTEDRVMDIIAWYGIERGVELDLATRQDYFGEVVAEADTWLTECAEQRTAGLADSAILRLVDAHFGGGLVAFVKEVLK